MAEGIKSFNRLNEPCADCGVAPNTEHLKSCNGGNHSIEAQDYAVAAAREWFAGTQRYIDSIVDVEWHPIKQGNAQAHLDAAIITLAAIIRKHKPDDRKLCEECGNIHS